MPDPGKSDETDRRRPRVLLKEFEAKRLPESILEDNFELHTAVNDAQILVGG